MNYWVGALRSLGRNLRRRDFAREWLSAGLRADNEPHAPVRWISEAFPAAAGISVEMGTVTYRPGNVTPFELYCLRAIAQSTRPDRIFEFGTFDGATTLALAQAAPGALVTTVDLPDAQDVPGANAPVDFETENRRKGGVGSEFRGKPEAARITQLLCDSRKIDVEAYRESMDLIFVDASHEEAFVRSDTELALTMLAPGGTLLWHDYMSGWPGVQHTIDDLLATGEPVIRLEHTTLAMLRR